MLINNRKDLLDMFDKCGELARYHVEACKTCTLCGDIEKANQHNEIIGKYIDIRWDILRILKEGSA